MWFAAPTTGRWLFVGPRQIVVLKPKILVALVLILLVLLHQTWTGNGIALVMTTGASDAHRTVRPHSERLRRFRYYGVASDKELDIDGMHVMDIVKTTPACYLEPEDLRYYTKLQNTTATQDALEEANEPDPAWRLARIVFYGAFERMYKLFPRAKWYLIMDNDTWVDAKGLQRYLRRYNPRIPYYLGSVALFDEIAFAHGGSLVTISAKAMEMAQKSEPHRSPRNEQWGDFTLALQLRQAGVNLTWLPMVKGRSPTETDYSDDEWCKPFLTLHHVTPEYLEKLDSLRRELGRTLIFADLNNHFSNNASDPIVCKPEPPISILSRITSTLRTHIGVYETPDP